MRKAPGRIPALDEIYQQNEKEDRGGKNDHRRGDPAAAQLSPEARVAILTALVAGYEHAGNAAECVEASNAAEGVVGALPEKLAEARERCLQSLPNRALLRGTSP